MTEWVTVFTVRRYSPGNGPFYPPEPSLPPGASLDNHFRVRVYAHGIEFSGGKIGTGRADDFRSSRLHNLTGTVLVSRSFSARYDLSYFSFASISLQPHCDMEVCKATYTSLLAG